MAQNTDERQESASFMAQNTEGPTVQLDSEEQVFAPRRKGKGSQRNRPGNEESAIRKETSDSNIPNDSLFQSKGLKCFRCGKDDHVLRDCPLPYAKVLAYAPQKGGETGTFMRDSESPELIDLNAQLPVEDAFIGNLSNPILRVEDREENPKDQEIEEGEDTWIGQWFQHDSMTFMTSVETEIIPNPVSAFEASSAKSDNPGASLVTPLIDSGAARTVCGKSWLLRWMRQGKTTLPQLSPSSTEFRFGSGHLYRSLGCLILTGWSTGTNKAGKEERRTLSFYVDVVDLILPMLISRESLERLEASLSFDTRILSVKRE